MSDPENLEWHLQESLAQNITNYLVDTKHISYEKALDIFYNSQLVDKIFSRKYGVQYLDYHVLADVLENNEPEIFM